MKSSLLLGAVAFALAGGILEFIALPLAEDRLTETQVGTLQRILQQRADAWGRLVARGEDAVVREELAAFAAVHPGWGSLRLEPPPAPFEEAPAAEAVSADPLRTFPVEVALPDGERGRFRVTASIDPRPHNAAAIAALRSRGLGLSVALAGAVCVVSGLLEHRAARRLRGVAAAFAAFSRGEKADTPPVAQGGPQGDLAASLARLRAQRADERATHERLLREMGEAEARARRNSDSAVLMREIATDLIEQPPGDHSAAVQRGLARIGEFFAADRAYVFDYDFNGGTTSNTFEWCAPGISPQIEGLQKVPNDAVPEWVEVHVRGESLLIEEVDRLPPGRLRDLLAGQEITSLLAVPLMERDRCLGFVGLDAVRRKTRFGEGERDLLRLFGEMLVNLRRRSRTERALEETRARLGSLLRERTLSLEDRNAHLTRTQFALDCVGIGITWIAADTGKILHANSEAGRQLGYTTEELLGLTVQDVNASLDESAMRAIAERLRATREPVTFESQRRRKDGSTFPVELKVAYQEAETGDFVIVFAEDISARKRDHQALEQAKAEALAASRAKSAFLANTSHEIRTPLNTILGVAQLLRVNCPEPQAERVARIETAARRLNAIIGDILDVAELEAGRLQLAEREFAVTELLGRIHSRLQEATRDRGLELGTEVVGTPARLRGDVTRLQQALTHYANNAAAFTPTGGITVAARLAEESADSVLVRFEVRDTGVGIPAEALGGLFQAFVQADGSSARRHGGTGLGLVVTRRLAELMGGEAGVESAPGRGSTFWFTARLQRVTDPADGPPPPAAPEPTAPVRLRGRVLLADRSAVNREVLLHLLRGHGLETDLAVDHISTLSLVGRHRYDLILLDLHLASMDGIDVLATLRRIPAARGVPVLALVSTAARGITSIRPDTAGELGLPVDPNRLLAALRRWMPAAPAEAPASALPVAAGGRLQ